MKELAAKTAVVTGAGSGMGRALAERFARAGMRVVLADIEATALDDVAASLAADGAEVLAVPTDVCDRAAVERLRDAAIERFGRVNLLCNNAGVGGAMPGTDIDLEEWRWVVEVNLWGVVHGHDAFLPHLLGHGDAHIVNTASMAGHTPNHSAYAASKWAVVSITEGLDQALRSQGSPVGVSCLCPGLVDTRFATSDRNRPMRTTPPSDAAFRAALARHLRLGMAPAHVAELVHDAVIAEQFWVFTDPAWVQRLAARFDGIVAAGEQAAAAIAKLAPLGDPPEHTSPGASGPDG